MITAHLEVERKFDADDAWALPDLSNVQRVAAVDRVAEVELDAAYFDTPDLRLAGRDITLRRRTGGPDEGWHLKLPRGERGRGARLELHHPLTAAADVPAELVREVAVHLRGEPLVPVATIATRRTVLRLRDGESRTLAEVADDHVIGSALDGSTGAVRRSSTWHEVEVELVDGSTDDLDAAEQVLVAAGATRSAARSKLARTIGPDADRIPRPARVRVGRRADAGSVLTAYLAAQVAALVATDPLVRQGAADPDGVEAVHRMRVATRRLRSALRTYRPLLDPARTDPVRAALGVLGARLGDVRDTQVMHAHLREALDALPDDLVVGPVRERIDATLDSREQHARTVLLHALDATDYFALLDALDALVTDPPLTAHASKRASEALPPLVRVEWKRLARRHDLARRAGDPDARDLALHEERKSAKRVRYAAEVAEPASGRDAERLVRRATQLQQSLGDHQDTVVARDLLRAVARDAAEHGEDGFTYGVLHGLEHERAGNALRDHAEAWRRASAGPVRRWIR